MRVLLRHLNKWLDPGTYGPEEAALALAWMEDGPELTEGLRARAAWLVRVAEEVERSPADGDENEDEEREKEHQARIIRRFAREERSSFYQAIMDLGGIKVHDDELRDEYRAIPNAYKRRDGLAGDVIANLLAQHHPQFNVTDERSLMDTFNRMGPSGRGRED
jgi:hypothetical protein